MSKFDDYNSEKRIMGRVAVGGNGVLIGRISFFDEGYTKDSILCVCDKDRVDNSSLLLYPPIAIVVICCDNWESIGTFCALGVPCIVLNQDETLSKACKNKIALIDTEKGILTLDPSIDTINFYSVKKSKEVPYQLACKTGTVLSVQKENIRGLAFERLLVSSEVFCRGESFFESAVSLWEDSCPELLILDMKIPKSGEREARRFEEQVEELFCASLYGTFALALSDFSCEDEITYAIKLLHKSFCLLEAEGREFNGYIPRGLVFSSPLWLMRVSPVVNPDFIILDLDKLLPAIFSLDSEQIIKKEKLLKKELFGVLERYLTNFAPRCDIYLKAKDLFGSRLLQEIVKSANIKIVFR